MGLITIQANLPTQYQTMLQRIHEYYPIIAKSSKNFYKSQSQFMDNMMTVSQPTELRSLRQILAEINKAKQALDEAYFGIQKKKIDIKRKQRLLENTTDDLDAELLNIEIQELESQISNSMNYVEGAIRKISAYTTQYQNILIKLGKDEFTEEDFEIDECRYHVMKAFEQGLCAARAHGGVIDEGNHIYFYQIGISGTAAQIEVSAFLSSEGEIVSRGKLPEHQKTWDWLHEMGNKYSPCAIEFARQKGMTLIDKQSLITE